ncbi:phosphatidylinositol mannoside acyltransferase [Demequina sediminicola]|uniref:phosphatidylinositol mannoside acyltransferase n=1 Tax=Demequina sediminicola TaxID=1095026 RepID=UPI0007857E20|nr:phosphatidylinositol mannoside acyltransferase [Demequina sediminicola]
MNAFMMAWRVSRWLPQRAVQGLATTGSRIVWRRGGRVVERYEDNLAKVTGLSGDALRAKSRAGLESVARYYAEALTLGRMSATVIDARVRLEGYEQVESILRATDKDKGVVAALSHSGNWDLVGAYASRNIIPVTAVAEILKPQEVFDEFVALREGIGIEVLGHEGSTTFRKLISIAQSRRTLICLLADRDLSGSGVEVEMWGRKVKVAPGPAALSSVAKIPLVPVMVHYEQLTGERRKRAGSKWGVVLSFGTPLHPGDYPREHRVALMSQAWASALADRIAEHPEDWHMLQRFGWVE